jgi:hypothetical protein
MTISLHSSEKRFKKTKKSEKIIRFELLLKKKSSSLIIYAHSIDHQKKYKIISLVTIYIKENKSNLIHRLATSIWTGSDRWPEWLLSLSQYDVFSGGWY